MKKLLFFLIAIIISMQAYSQVDVQIGSGSTYYYDPLPGWYGWNRSAYLYKSTEINSGGVINSVAFQIQTASTGTTAKIKIYLIETTMNAMPALGATNWNALKTGATLVYQNNAFAGSPTGWKTILLDLPFAYTGVDNLLVLVEGEGCSTSGGCSSQCFNHDSPATHWYLRKDTSAPDDNAGSTSASGYEGKRANIIFNISPSGNYCYPPSQLTVSNITTNTADFTWGTDVSGLSWIVQYKLNSETDWSTEQTVYSGSYNLQGLLPNSFYNFRVKSICATNESGWNTINFNTACGSVTSFPWIEGFETAFTTTAVAPGNAVAPNCWLNFNEGSSTYLWRRTTTAAYIRTGAAAAQHYTSATIATNDYLVTPIITLTGNERLRFYVKGYSTYVDHIRVGIYDITQNAQDITSITDTSLFTTILPHTFIPQNGWTEVIVNLNNYIGDFRIAFIRDMIGGYYLNLDDVTIETIPTCPQPISSTFTIEETSATINWVPADPLQTSFYLYYKASTATTYDSILVSSTSYLLQNLTAGTSYNYYIKADCGSELSSPTPVKTFKTLCPAITTLPVSEFFDSYTGTGAGTFPTCWYKNSTHIDYPYLSTTNASSPASLYFYAGYTGAYNIAISPKIDATIPINTIKANLKFRASGLDDTLYVGVMSDPYDVSTFEQVGFLVVTTTGAFQDKEFYFSNYTGTGQFIAIKAAFAATSSTIYIDNVVLDLIPACPNPTSLNVSGVIDTEVNLGWLENGTATTWNIEYGPTGFTQGSGITITSVTANPYTLSGLTPQTTYQFYVQADCGAGTLSTWSSPYTFTTACVPVSTVPYTENFDTYGSATGVFPSCWFRPVLNTTTPYPSIVTAYSVSTPSSLRFQSASATEPTYAITPQLNVDINTLRVLFKLKAESITSSGTMHVGVMSDPLVPSTFELVQVITPTNTNFNDYEVSFANTTLTGTGKYIAFKHVTSSSSYYYWLDNVVVDLIPSCAKPTQLATSNITLTGADVSWLPGNTGDAAWWLYYKPASTTSFDSVQVFAFPYTLTNLNPSTVYQYYLRTDCGTELSEASTISNFTTLCGNIISLPFMDNFDSYSTGTSVMPTCWTRINTYTSGDRPYVNTGGRVANCLYFFTGTAGTYNIAVMPPIDPSIAINTLRVKFYAKNYSSTDRMVIGVMSDPTLASTFEPVDTIAPTSAWLPYEVNLNNYVGLGTHIAFKNEYTTTSSYGYIDDLEIDYIPSCLKPTQITASNITLNSADISWTPGNVSDNAWWIYWQPINGTTLDSVYVTSMPYQLAGLQASTIYKVYIKTDCGSDLSEFSTLYSFSTLCGQVTQLPYTESFDYYGTTAGVFPTCWFRPILNTTTPFPSIVSANVVSSPGSLKFQSASSSVPTFAVTPELNLDINTLRVVFKLKAESTTSSGTMHVGVMSDPTDTSTFELVQIITPTSTSYTEYEIFFANTTLSGTGNHIAFKHVTNASNYYYWLDDVVVDLIPACAKPTQLAATNVTISTADINWIPGNTSDVSWWIYWKPTSATSYDSLLISSNPFTLTNLLTNTFYQVYLKTDCGSEISQASSILTFKTPCDAVTTIPYTENFDTYGTATGAFPSCWFRPVLYSTTPYPSIVTANAVSSPGNLRFQSASSTQPTYAITPQFDVDINTLRVTFKLKAESLTYSGTMQVGVMSDPNNLTTFELVETIVPTSTSYSNYEVMFTNTVLSGTGKFIAFRHITSSSSYYYWLEDVVVDLAPTCVKPTQIVASNLTISNANISWVPGYATDNSWWIYWKTTTATTYDSVLVNTNPYTLPGLSPATTYQLYMKTDCGSQLSVSSNTITFTTPCVPITSVPYIEYFDTYTTGTSAYPTCWSKLTSNATYPYISTTNFSTPGSLYLYSSATGGYCHAITPMFDATIPINTLKAEFKLRNGANDDTLYVGVMTDPTDLSTFVLVQKLIPTATTTWQDMEVFFNNYNGTGQYIAFKNVYTTTTTTIYVDNLEIFTIPTCPRPTQLVSSNSTSTSTTLSWTEAGSATSWNIEYGPIGFTPGSGTILPASSNPFILNGLTHSTCYDFYVQAVCSQTDLSIWSNKGTFCTAQITANVPFNIDFETPSGVQIANNTSGNNWYIGADTANTVNNSTGGQNALYVSNDNGQTNAFTITTAAVVWAYRDVYFTPSTTDYTFSFNWKGNGEGTTTAYDYLSVYIGTPTMPVVSTTSTITVPTGSDTIVTKLRLQPTWQTATFTMPTASYSGQIKRIYFMWRNDGSGGTQPPAAVDNISITSTGISTCLPPTNVASSSITPTSAQITWTAGGTETAWELDYKLASASTWTTIPVATNATYLLNTLSPVSAYEVRVRAVCGASEFSEYTPIHTFTTTNTPCDVPTNLQVTNITDQSALATWNAGTAISWQVEYKLVSSANWTSASTTTPSFQISGLQSNSNYEVRVKAICTSNESSFTATVPFTTTGGTVTYTITATAGANGTITPSGAVTVNQGANQTFNFAPTTGYIVSVVTVDGSPITGAPTSYTFTNVSANRTIHVDFISGISENELAQLVELFPNPTTSTIELRLKSEDLHVKECKIYDMYGKLMRTILINAETTSIDVTDFASGVYFVRMDSERGTISKKFVKK